MPETWGKWLRLLAWEIPILAITASAFLYWRSGRDLEPTTPGPVSLTVTAQPGQLRVEWNRKSQAIKSASQGWIEITDGVESQSVTLTTAMLAAGNYIYVPETEDVRMRMIISQSSGDRTEESVRFLGGWPKKEAPPQIPNELETEARRLQEMNDSQAQRIHDLERSVSALEKNLGITPP